MEGQGDEPVCRSNKLRPFSAGDPLGSVPADGHSIAQVLPLEDVLDFVLESGGTSSEQRSVGPVSGVESVEDDRAGGGRRGSVAPNGDEGEGE